MNQLRSPGLGKLFSSSGIYFLAGLGQQAVGFLLLPLYTNVLSPAEYGALEILITTGFIAVMVLNLGLPSAIMKCYHRDCDSEHDRQTVLATSLVIELPILAVGCLLLLLSADWLTGTLLGPGHAVRLVRLMVVWVFLTGVSGIVLALFRAREEALLLGTLTLGTFALLMFLNVYFVWALRLGVQGVLLGNCVSTGATILVSVFLLKTRATLRINAALIRPLAGFGVLIVPAALSGWIMGMADRYFLAYFGHLADVGVYSLGYKLGMVLEVLIVSPFQLAWPPFSFAISENEGHQRVYARTLTYLTLASSACVLGLTMLAPVALHYATHPDYFQAHTVVPLIGLAYTFNGIYYCVAPGIHIRRQSKWLPLIVAAAAALNIALCVLLIPRFGMMGAAWATMLSFAVLASATFAVAQTVYPVSYEYRRLAKIALAATAIYGVSTWLPAEPPLAKAVADVVIVVLGFPLLLLAGGFLERDEREAIGRLLRWLPARRNLSVVVGVVTSAPRAEIKKVRTDLKT